MKDGFGKLMVAFLIAMMVLPALASGHDDDVIPGVDAESDDLVALVDDVRADSGFEADTDFLSSVIVGTSGIVVVIVMVVFGAVTIEALRALKISVPAGAAQPYIQPVFEAGQSGLEQFQEQARLTPTPVDDLIGNFLQLPMDKLKEALEKRGYILIDSNEELADVDLSSLPDYSPKVADSD